MYVYNCVCQLFKTTNLWKKLPMNLRNESPLNLPLSFYSYQKNLNLYMIVILTPHNKYIG